MEYLLSAIVILNKLTVINWSPASLILTSQVVGSPSSVMIIPNVAIGSGSSILHVARSSFIDTCLIKSYDANLIVLENYVRTFMSFEF